MNVTTGTPRVRTGLDVLAGEGFGRLKGRRVGAICNPTTVDGRMRHLADHLRHAADIELVALFGPEHGVRAELQDMEGADSGVDSRTGVPVHSLYGPDVSSLTPTADQLAGIDLLVFDVQDVGSRYYTFAATMLYAMRAAAGRGIGFLVLDRPNPIGGEAVEGPTVRPGYESFVGAYPLPIRHGMTVGELARLFHAEERLDLDLDVVPCEGWRRSMSWAETGLSWVLPSPNMPTPDTALVYPGGCLLEGTNLSEGRGTTRPFELWGAPWIDPYAIADAFAGVAGASLRPCTFQPTFHKHAGLACLGVQPHATDSRTFRPILLYAGMIALARAQDPGRFAWRTEPYEFVREPIAIDLLFGSSRERERIEAGELPVLRGDRVVWEAVADDWTRDEDKFRARRAPYLIYA